MASRTIAKFSPWDKRSWLIPLATDNAHLDIELHCTIEKQVPRYISRLDVVLTGNFEQKLQAIIWTIHSINFVWSIQNYGLQLLFEITGQYYTRTLPHSTKTW